MTFVSYAQNYEDVMLWRALKHIDKGFYIDVGAWSPDIDSVSKAFHERGWQGINIEPNPGYIAQYAEKRRKDINLCVAVSDHVGEAEMYFVSNPGLSSLDRSIAEGHISLGWETTPANVKIRTLVDICEEHCLKRDIHFLKIDAEGFEEQVLRGNDWAHFRPWVIVVEATLPMSQVENHEEWEPILLNARYSLAYVDGLNRFYVAVEHEELLAAFKYPPNVFDDLKVITEVQSEAKAKQAEEKAKQAEAKAKQAESKAKQAESKAKQTEAEAKQTEAEAEKIRIELHRVYNSRSWQITEPLRLGNLQVKLLKQHGISVRLKSLVKKVTQLAVKRSMIFVSSRPALRLKLGKISRRLGFHSALKSVYLKLNTNSVSNSHNKFDLRAESLTKQPYRRSLYQPDYSGEKLSVDEILIRIRTELADSGKARNNE